MAYIVQQSKEVARFKQGAAKSHDLYNAIDFSFIG